MTRVHKKLKILRLNGKKFTKIEKVKSGTTEKLDTRSNALAQAGCYMYSKKEPVYLNGQWKSDEGKKYLSPVAVIPDLETMKKTNTGVTDKESYRSEVMSMLRISETDGVEAMQCKLYPRFGWRLCFFRGLYSSCG